MEQIKRPQVQRASCQIRPAGRLSNNGSTAADVGRFLHAVFVPRLRWSAAVNVGAGVIARAAPSKTLQDTDATGLVPPPRLLVSRCQHPLSWCGDSRCMPANRIFPAMSHSTDTRVPAAQRV